jgi:hypothetical protein
VIGARESLERLSVQLLRLLEVSAKRGCGNSGFDLFVKDLLLENR